MENQIAIVAKEQILKNCTKFFECNNWFPTFLGVCSVICLYAISFAITSFFEKHEHDDDHNQSQNEEYFYENVTGNRVNLKNRKKPRLDD